jgi:phosphatidylinositol kinase/protein kinase (PI-3  family)
MSSIILLFTFGSFSFLSRINSKLGEVNMLIAPRRKMTERRESANHSFRRGTFPSLQYTSILNISSENYYALVAIESLVHILSDVALSTYHTKAISALVSIIKECLGGHNAEQFLPQIMPPLLQAMRVKDNNFCQFVFSQLAILVRVVKRAMANYLDEVFDVVQERWQMELLPSILDLVEETSIAFGDEFKVRPNFLILTLTLILILSKK